MRTFGCSKSHDRAAAGRQYIGAGGGVVRGIRRFARSVLLRAGPVLMVLGAWMLYNDSTGIRLVGAFLVLLAFVMTLD